MRATTMGSGTVDGPVSPLKKIAFSHAASIGATFGPGSTMADTLPKLRRVTTMADTLARVRAGALASTRSAWSPALALSATTVAGGILDSQVSPAPNDRVHEHVRRPASSLRGTCGCTGGIRVAANQEWNLDLKGAQRAPR
jgi:hypothetical protein